MIFIRFPWNSSLKFFSQFFKLPGRYPNALVIHLLIHMKSLSEYVHLLKLIFL